MKVLIILVLIFSACGDMPVSSQESGLRESMVPFEEPAPSRCFVRKGIYTVMSVVEESTCPNYKVHDENLLYWGIEGSTYPCGHRETKTSTGMMFYEEGDSFVPVPGPFGKTEWCHLDVTEVGDFSPEGMVLHRTAKYSCASSGVCVASGMIYVDRIELWKNYMEF